MEMDGRNGQTETRDHTLVDIEDEKVYAEDEQATHEIVTDMKGELQSVSRISKHRCIYRVPKNLRDINESAYVPRLVSLGPFHHGNANLKAMEDQKWRYFQSFIGKNHMILDDLVRLMKKHEEETRGFYGECIVLESAQFVKVMLVDAIFVINHLLLETQSSCSTTTVISIYDEDFFRFQVFRDMLLLENQLPFFILEKILDFARSTNGTTITERRSITELTHCYINKIFMKKEGAPDLNGDEVMHFVDFLSLCYMPEERRRNCKLERIIKSMTELHKAEVRFKDEGKLKRIKSMTELHKAEVRFKDEGKLKRIKSMTELHKAGVRFKDEGILEKIIKSMTELQKAEVRFKDDEGKLQRIKSMTKLHKAGVRFKLALPKTWRVRLKLLSTNTLLDIQFNNGVLEIPSIDVFDSTETIFRNLLAYDQCHWGHSYISDYFLLMGMLIDTPDDVELLVKNNILKNQLATNQEVSKVFNNLEKEVLYDEDSFYYSELCKNLNEYCEKRRHKWMANLRQNYLDTPWKVISVIVASILLVLTVIQTVFTIINP